MPRLAVPLAAGLAVLAAAPAAAAPREIQIAYIQRLDWTSDYPQCLECFVAHSAVPGDWTVTHEAIDLALLVSGEQDISEFELGVITGHLNYTFLEEERTILEDFVTNGGILWFDDCGNVEVDNLPFGLEINFGGAELGAWGTCYGDLFVFPDPSHPLLTNVCAITPPIMRTDPGLNDARWFTPFYEIDPRYSVVATGTSVGTYTFTGPAIIAARMGRGAIVATAMDVTCAMECVSYGNPERPLSDYYLVINMIAWYDSDGDGIFDHDEGEYVDPEPDSDGDTVPDARELDSDGDTITDAAEAGDDSLDTPPVDTDGDTLPDFRDTDSDGDTITDRNEQTADADGDGFPDPDADGDGIPNRLDPDSDGDTMPDATEGEDDVDGDGIADFVDADDTDGPLGDSDGDTVPNGTDDCPDVPDPGQTDSDGDTVGDACDDTPYPPDGGDGGGDGAGPDADADAPVEAGPDDASAGCDPGACMAQCRADGHDGGTCVAGACRCSGGPDGGGDASADAHPPGIGTGGAGCGCSATGARAPAVGLLLALAAAGRATRRRRR
jgi:MYXO-CTERM domain-containing protein